MTAVLPTLGPAALVAALLAYIASFLAYNKTGIDPADASLNRGRKALLLAGISLLVSSLSLMGLLFARDYHISYVYSHVSNDLPGLYVFSAFWAGQEGSFLLWALLAALLGSFLTMHAGDWEARVMRIYLPSAIVLVILTLISGPFKTLSGNPADGAGLNPLLRDPWMAIHPPVTFLGYAALAVPFAFALAGMGQKDAHEWVRRALPWTLAGWLTLGTGIIMGGFWAYKVLGWGGWWGWDPVENASLLPWLTAMALFHGLLLQRARRKLARTNIMLAILTFGLVIYSTFLTRSGVLGDASVHTFGDSVVGPWVALWLASVVLYGIYRLAGTRMKTAGESLSESLFSREILLFVGVVVLVVTTGVVGLGTSAPLFSRLTGGGGAAVDISFYGRTTLPLGILLALGTGLSVMFRWKDARVVSNAALWAAVVTGVIGTGLAYLIGLRSLLHLIFAGSAVFALSANLIAFERALSQGGIRNSGAFISHIGAALMLIAVVVATTGRKQKVDLIYETPTGVLGYELTFTGWASEPGGKQSATVTLSRAGGTSTRILRPKLYRQYGSGQMMVRAEPHIRRSLGGDLYLAPAQYLPPEQALAESGEAFTLAKGESREAAGIRFAFEEYDMTSHGDEGGPGAIGSSIGARVRIEWENESQYIVPRMAFGGAPAASGVALPGELGGELRLQAIDADRGTVTLLYSSSDIPIDGRAVGGILTVELSEKPLMGILWTGVILVLLGGGLAIWRRTILLESSSE